jgi:hypothetical protein
MRELGAALFADSVHRWGRSSPRPSEHTAVRCDFCESPTAQWRYPVHQGHGWKACQGCHTAIVADDREALRKRVLLVSGPTAFPYRYAPRLRHRARELSENFWGNRAGVAEPLHA